MVGVVPSWQPNQAELVAILDYNPATGDLVWKDRISGSTRRKGGGIAGYVRPDGYRTIDIGKKPYFAHRVIWCMVTGDWPERDIDHKNRIRNDNRWLNLRSATESQNAANTSYRKPNKAGARGVEITRHGRYRVRIRHQGKLISLGIYADLERAKAVYEKAARELFGEFSPV